MYYDESGLECGSVCTMLGKLFLLPILRIRGWRDGSAVESFLFFQWIEILCTPLGDLQLPITLSSGDLMFFLASVVAHTYIDTQK